MEVNNVRQSYIGYEFITEKKKREGEINKGQAIQRMKNCSIMAEQGKKSGRQISKQDLGCVMTADVKNNTVNTGDHISQDSLCANKRYH